MESRCAMAEFNRETLTAFSRTVFVLVSGATKKGHQDGGLEEEMDLPGHSTSRTSRLGDAKRQSDKSSIGNAASEGGAAPLPLASAAKLDATLTAESTVTSTRVRKSVRIDFRVFMLGNLCLISFSQVEPVD